MKGLLQAFQLPYQRASGHMRFKSYFPMLHQSEKPPNLVVLGRYKILVGRSRKYRLHWRPLEAEADEAAGWTRSLLSAHP